MAAPRYPRAAQRRGRCSEVGVDVPGVAGVARVKVSAGNLGLGSGIGVPKVWRDDGSCATRGSASYPKDQRPAQEWENRSRKQDEQESRRAAGS